MNVLQYTFRIYCTCVQLEAKQLIALKLYLSFCTEGFDFIVDVSIWLEILLIVFCVFLFSSFYF